jgi:HptB-dependent secretion and biofilm anti anti-sigma factor
VPAVKVPKNTETELRASTPTVITPTLTGAVLSIAVGGRFDFHCYQAFCEAFEGWDGVNEYRVDLAGAEYIDSSAMGMLLLLREKVGARGMIKVVNCNPTVRRILEIANFQRLFELS